MSQERSKINHSLGDYIGMLVVDVRHFSQHNDAQQQVIVSRMLEILNQAADRAGLPSLWQDNVFRAFRGDGYAAGFAADLVGAVVDRFFDSLQNELRRRSRDFRMAGIEFRVRTSLHLGPAASFDELLTDSPTGRVMIEAHRMVDADTVRALLDNSDPDVTFVASVLSNTVMEHVVEAGRTTRRPSEFVDAPLHVSSKEYSGKGYLRVPVLSGDLLRFGLLRGQPEPSAERNVGTASTTESGSRNSNSFIGTANDVVQARDVQGGIDSYSVRAADGGIAVQGNKNITAGRSVDLTTNKQEFAGTFHTAGDANFGPSSGRRDPGGTEAAAR